MKEITTNIHSDEVKHLLSQVENLVNIWEGKSVTQFLSPRAWSDLSQKVIDAIDGKQIIFKQELRSIESIWSDALKVRWKYMALWIGWRATGLSNFYILENVGGHWLIVDTDFYQFMPDVAGAIKKSHILLILLWIFLSWAIFWLWMYFHRQIGDNWLWYCISITVVIVGSILFFVRKKQHQKCQQENPWSA